MADTVTLIQEMIEEDMDAMRSVFVEDFVPLLKHRRKMEREAFDKAYDEVQTLEEI